MASRFIVPVADVGSGIKPSSGAKLFFFESGTSTPKDTYTTASADTANSNPVIADSTGVFPDIFITGTYKVTLTDKNDVQKGFGEKDPITESASLEASNLSYDLHDTLSGAKARTDLVIGMAIRITDRGDGIFDVVTSQTANDLNIIAHDTLNLQLKLRVGEFLYDLQMGAVIDDTVDSILARQATIDLAATENAIAVLSAGCMHTTVLRIKSMQKVIDLATRSNPTRIPIANDVTALRFQTNEIPEYIGGYFMHFDYSGLSKVFQTRGSRTGIGLDVFGDIAGGSSVQAVLKTIGFEGFGVGGKYAGCFNSSFYDLTMKRNDIQTLLLNDTNNSVKFYNLRSNLDCQVHVKGDPELTGVGLASSGAVFYSPEWENATAYPWFNVTSGTSAWYDIITPYSFENNNGTDVTSEFTVFKMTCAGRFHMVGGAMNSTGKSDSRIFQGFRGNSLLSWDVKIIDTKLDSLRVSGVDFDIDYDATKGDSVTIGTGCTYGNTAAPNNNIGNFGTEQGLYKRDAATGDAFNWHVNTARMKFDGMAAGVDFRLWDNAFLGINTNGGNAYNTGGFLFRNGVNNSYLWTDTTGVLRIKTGSAPTNDTDGTVVGTQT